MTATTPLTDKDLAAEVYSKNPGQFEFALSLERLSCDWGACVSGQFDVSEAATAAGMKRLAPNHALPLAELVERLVLDRTGWMLSSMYEDRGSEGGGLIRAIYGDIYLALAVRFKERGVKGAMRDAGVIGRAYHSGKKSSDAVAAVCRRHRPRFFAAESNSDEEQVAYLLYGPSYSDGTLAEVALTGVGQWWGKEAFKTFLAEVIRLRVRPQVEPKGEPVVLDVEGAAA